MGSLQPRRNVWRSAIQFSINAMRIKIIFTISLLFFSSLNSFFSQGLGVYQAQENQINNPESDSKKLTEKEISDADFRTDLDSIFLLPTYQKNRYRDIDRSLDDHYRVYDLFNRYDVISTGGFNLISRPFSLLKNESLGFNNQFITHHFLQEVPLIQTYRPVSKIYFVHDPFYLGSSRNTTQINAQHYQPLGKRVSLVINWNVLGTGGYISQNKQNVTSFGSKLYYHNLSATLWSINSYYYQSETYRISGGLTDEAMLKMFEAAENEEYFSGLNFDVKFKAMSDIWITQKVQSDNYWIFSKADEKKYFDPQRRSFLRYEFRYYNGQSFLAGKNTGNEIGFSQYAQSPNGLQYVADFRRNEAFQNEITLQGYGKIFTPLFLSTVQIGFEHQMGTYNNRYYQGAIPVDLIYSYLNNLLLKGGLKWEIGPFTVENKTVYGFFGYSQNDISTRTVLGLETLFAGGIYLTHQYQKQQPAFENQQFNSTFLTYDVRSTQSKEEWNRYELHYRHFFDNKFIYSRLDIKANYAFFRNYILLDNLGYPINWNNFNYFQVDFAYHIRVWKFGLRNEISYFAHDNFNDLSLPSYSYRGALYYQDVFLKGALGFWVGVDFTYYPNYYPWEYIPARHDFSPFNSSDLLVAAGNYPFFDLYIAFKISKAKISLKYTNAFFGYNSNFNRFNSDLDVGYFSARGYLFNESVIKLGIDWLLEY